MSSGVIATAIALGVSHSCAITAAGVVKCWGSNNQVQLGTGLATPTQSSSPVDVIVVSSVLAVRGMFVLLGVRLSDILVNVMIDVLTY